MILTFHHHHRKSDSNPIYWPAGRRIWELTTCATIQKFLNLSKGIASILFSNCAVAFVELAGSDIENSRAGAEVWRDGNRARVNGTVPGRPRGRRSLRIKIHCRIGRVGHGWGRAYICTGRGVVVVLRLGH